MDFVFKIFLLQFFVLGILLNSARSQQGDTDCNGKDYLCLDDNRFQICVDFGDGRPRTVDSETQLCPRGTFCSNAGQFECDSYTPPRTTAAPQVSTQTSGKYAARLGIPAKRPVVTPGGFPEVPSTTSEQTEALEAVSENLFLEYDHVFDLDVTHESVPSEDTPAETETAETSESVSAGNVEAENVEQSQGAVTEEENVGSTASQADQSANEVEGNSDQSNVVVEHEANKEEVNVEDVLVAEDEVTSNVVVEQVDPVEPNETESDVEVSSDDHGNVAAASEVSETDEQTGAAEVSGDESSSDTVQGDENNIPSDAEEQVPSDSDAANVPAEEEAAASEDTPAQEEAVAAEEVPVEEEVTAAEETPAEEEAPAALEEGAVDEEATASEDTPAEEEAVAAEEVPAEEEVAAVEEGAADEEAATAEVVPVEEEAQEDVPTVEEVPTAEEDSADTSVNANEGDATTTEQLTEDDNSADDVNAEQPSESVATEEESSDTVQSEDTETAESADDDEATAESSNSATEGSGTSDTEAENVNNVDSSSTNDSEPSSNDQTAAEPTETDDSETSTSASSQAPEESEAESTTAVAAEESSPVSSEPEQEPEGSETATETSEAGSPSAPEEGPEEPSNGSESTLEPETTTEVSTEPAPCVCTAAGRFPHPTDCHKYYTCIWLPFGLFEVEQNCALGFAYNPTLQRCTADQSICFPGEFSCAAPGRFPDDTDPTRYFWCVWNIFGGYLQYNLQCPVGQVFNPFRSRCVAPLTPRLGGEEDAPLDPADLEPSLVLDDVTDVEETVTEKPKFECLEEGTFPDPNNCARYFICTLKKKDKFKKSKLKCVKGERYDAVAGACIADDDAICG